MDITSEIRDNVLVVHLSGSLDTLASPQLRQAECLSRRSHHTVLDLARVQYMDSAGLGAIVSVMKGLREAQKKIALASPGPMVTKVLAVTAVDKIIPIKPSVEEAVALLAQEG